MHLIKPLIETLTFKEILIILKKFWLNNMDNLNLTLQVFNTQHDFTEKEFLYISITGRQSENRPWSRIKGVLTR